MVLEKLEPKIVWDIFEHVLAATPRESKKEDRIRAVIKDWVTQQAKTHQVNVTIHEDDVGNILLKIPPTPGFESCPPVMLQGHLDMVCETNRPKGFDFDNSPIPVSIEENKEWVTAEGTTLGADNGIGVAMALALLVDEDAVHGPLEILLTIDEETGLTGAFGLDVDKLDPHARLLLNLDSEDFGVITIGSAGGGEVTYSRDLVFNEPTEEYVFLKVIVNGLRGGHSGGDIHRHRANAHKLVARLISAVTNEHEVVLSSWTGGSKHNAIPRESTAVIGVKSNEIGSVRDILHREREAIIDYYHNEGTEGVLEPEIRISFSEVAREKHLSPDLSRTIISTINALPHGPNDFSPQIPDLVETSTNLAIIKTSDSTMSIYESARSNVDAELEAYRRSLADIGHLGGWNVELDPAYPGWTPNPNSPFLKFVREQYERVVGGKVRVEAVHAGLECGIIGSRIIGMQMVSVGPTIQNPHTPDERVNIKSVQQFYSFLKVLLRELPSAIL
ncbi:MAG: beta-Ala-His dipeptidase [Candidatus Thorarchaeota archaeon]